MANERQKHRIYTILCLHRMFALCQSLQPMSIYTRCCLLNWPYEQSSAIGVSSVGCIVHQIRPAILLCYWNEDKIGDPGLGMMICRSLGGMLYSTSAYASGMNYPAEHTISPLELQITVSKVSALIIRVSFQLNHMHSLVWKLAAEINENVSFVFE